MEPPGSASPDAIARRVARLRGVLGLAMLVMLSLSGPLWVGAGGFPQVPFLGPRLGVMPPGISWALFVALLVAVVLAAVGIAWRASMGVSLVLLAVFVLWDQHRFQPWVYQYLMTGLLLAALPEREALWYVRWWFVALYVHSGLSKLDVSFCDGLGFQFLRTAVRPVGLDPSAWPRLARNLAVLAMPAGEIAIAAALLVSATRRLGRIGAVGLHLALLGILGPWGLRHSAIVLIWNLATMVEVWIAFGPERAEDAVTSGPEPALGRFVRVVFWAGVVLPLGERQGLFDPWPSHALYASHVARTDVYLLEDERDEYPEAIRRHLEPAGPGPWCRLNLTAWSRAVRGVPVYPSSRACNGLAEALAARYGGRRLIRVVQLGRADRWTGERAAVECLGLEAIRRQGDRYRLNAHPARARPGTADRPTVAGPTPLIGP
jgi:hypothetical protein